MRHTSVPVDHSIEFIDIVPLNPLISKCNIKVCYVQDEPNRNQTVITREFAKELANSLPGNPIVGLYNEEEKDFEGHNKKLIFEDGVVRFVDETRPYGFVDLNAKVWFQKFIDDGEIEREYLMTEGYLWTGQYPEAQKILEGEKGQSMELDAETVKGVWTKDTNKKPKFFIINEAIISKLCILGDEVEPCFEGAQVVTPATQFSFEESFKQQLFSMMGEITELLKEEKGGAIVNLEDQKEVELVEEELEEITENKDIEEVVEEEAPEVNSAEEVIEEEKEEEEIVVVEEEVKSYSLDDIPEYTSLKADFEELQTKYSTLQEEFNTISSEKAELTTFKKGVERKEKEAMIRRFFMLSDEDKQDVLDNIDTYSVDEIESKLSVICVRNRVNFSAIEDEVKDNDDILTYNISETKDTGSVPEFILALRDTKEKMESNKIY